MRAVIWTRYGPPEGLQLREVEKPSPKANEVLIKVHATTVTTGDCEMRSLRIPLSLRLLLRAYNGVTRPKRITILGQELAGEIESVGTEARARREGDQVFAATGLGFGAYAEYVCLPQDGMVETKPANMTYEEAAAIPTGGLNALHFLRMARIQSGQKVVINGAGGSIGTIAVQLAKAFGAEVTAIDSTRKLDMLCSLGADHVIDYTREDFTESGESYDVIFDVAGKGSFSGAIRSLKEGGTYLLGNPSLSRRIRGRWTSRTSSKRVFARTASYKPEDLIFLRGLVEAGKITTVIDRRYPLEEIAEAHRYVETGQKKGNVVINVEHLRT
jgi:2-desacetyl-2-hydroxyethyl bacteriochlorophyllide A dehydrogenase